MCRLKLIPYPKADVPVSHFEIIPVFSDLVQAEVVTSTEEKMVSEIIFSAKHKSEVRFVKIIFQINHFVGKRRISFCPCQHSNLWPSIKIELRTQGKFCQYGQINIAQFDSRLLFTVI